VIAREYSFTLSRPSVPAGEVTVEFVNRGEDPHNLNFSPASGESETFGTFPSTEPEHRRDQTLVMHPGSYTLFCSLPGHRAAGMSTTLLVQ
jgi:plastocyanin